MDISHYKDAFQIQLPVAINGKFWNGRTDEFNNIGNRLTYSQKFGMTPYAKTGIYGKWLNPKTGKKEIRPHNGHDIAGGKDTPLVAPCKVWTTYIGWEKKGYGNYIFFETETVKVNGTNFKMEFVLAHASKIKANIQKWYNPGALLAIMGNTGMSTGIHTHLGGRPLIMIGGKWVHLFEDDGARGYIDLTDFFITKPIYDKQILINQVMQLIKKKGDSNIYVISPDGKANLIVNWPTFVNGSELKMWGGESDIRR